MTKVPTFTCDASLREPAGTTLWPKPNPDTLALSPKVQKSANTSVIWRADTYTPTQELRQFYRFFAFFSGNKIHRTAIGNEKNCYQDLSRFCEELSSKFLGLS